MRSISGVVKAQTNQALYLSVNVVALAQSVEHRIVAPKVTGSSPVGHPTSQPNAARNLLRPSSMCSVAIAP